MARRRVAQSETDNLARRTTSKRAYRACLAISALTISLVACGSTAPKASTSAAAGQPAVMAAHARHAAALAPGTTKSSPVRTAPATVNVYSHDGAGDLSPKVKGQKYLVYVPESASSYVDVINPATFEVIDRYYTGYDPQHVVPAWDLKTLYAANDLGNSLTPIDPYTGEIAGPNIPVTDPYNMYFTPNGKYAIVVEEADQTLAFRNPRTFALVKAVHVDCPGVDHGDFSANGTFAVFSCEFSARLVKIDLSTMTVARYLDIPGSSPQDLRLDPAGRIFYVADRNRGGVYEVSANNLSIVGFIPTGSDAHGLYFSRNARYLYVSNRGSGTVSVIDVKSRKVVQTWTIPGGGSPDMGNVSPDGKELWLSGRYNACVYVFSTGTGKLLPNEPHGLVVWPQPGRYSLGHTGIMR
jgi:YVTN family beta-propeller protein